MTIGQRLRLLRTALGLQQADVAKRSGFAPTAVSLIESGQTEKPRRATLEAIAGAMQVPVEALTDDVACAREVLRVIGVSPETLLGMQPPQKRVSPAAAKLKSLLRELLEEEDSGDNPGGYREPDPDPGSYSERRRRQPDDDVGDYSEVHRPGDEDFDDDPFEEPSPPGRPGPSADEPREHEGPSHKR